MKEQIDERKREVEILLMQRRTEDENESHFSRRRSPRVEQPEPPRQSVMEMDDDDDDDAVSVATAMPEDRDGGGDDDGDDERRRQTDELGRPHTPEPTGHMSDLEYEEERRMAEAAQTQASREFASQSSVESSSVSALSAPTPATANGHLPAGSSHADLAEIFNQNALLTTRLETLSAQLESAMELSRTLQNQASMAQSTIAVLESKVGTLEAYVNEQREKATSPLEPSTTTTPSELTVDTRSDESSTPEPPSNTEVEAVIAQSKWDEWRDRVEGGWKTERETWEDERQRLASAVKEWERRTSDLERKEGERREREEAAERRRQQNHEDAPGFDTSSDEEEVNPENGFRIDKRLPGMVNGMMNGMMNGFTPKKVGKGARRRKSHGKANGMPNGITILPSPMSSPSSSISSSYASQRRSESPTSEHHHPLVNGKLPISPPNTSPPRSRPESLTPLADVGEESPEEPGDGESSLGLVNGISSSQSSLPSSATDDGKNRVLANGFVSSATEFAMRNGGTGHTFSQAFGDIVSRSSSSFHAWLFMAVASLLMVWTVTDVIFLFFPSLFPLPLLPSSIYYDQPTPTFLSDLLSPFFPAAATDLVASFSSTFSSLAGPVPSSFLANHSTGWKYLQPLPYISAASMVIVGVAAWALVNRERMGG